MNKEFFALITQVGLDKGIAPEVVLDSLKSALAAAYQQSNEAEDQDIRVEIDPNTAAIRVFRYRTVVDEIEDATQISLEEAKGLQPKVKLGAQLREDVTPEN